MKWQTFITLISITTMKNVLDVQNTLTSHKVFKRIQLLIRSALFTLVTVPSLNENSRKLHEGGLNKCKGVLCLNFARHYTKILTVNRKDQKVSSTPAFLNNHIIKFPQ